MANQRERVGASFWRTGWDDWDKRDEWDRRGRRPTQRTAASFFLKRGYASLAYVGTNDTEETKYDRARRESFIARAAEGGIAAKVFQMPPGSGDAPALVAFIKSLARPCGVFTYADGVSLSVLRAIRLARLRVPDQIAVLGVDDDVGICESTTPTLSSICPDFERAGEMAAALLNRQLRGGKPRRKGRDILYGIRHLAERDSTTDLRGGGRLVSAAAAYVEQHFAENISVEGIARRLHVSRRLLELRYRDIGGTTLQEAILSHRLERARELLKTTGLSFGAIAAQTGFRRYATLAVLFRRRYGHSLGDERRAANPPPARR